MAGGVFRVARPPRDCPGGAAQGVRKAVRCIKKRRQSRYPPLAASLKWETVAGTASVARIGMETTLGGGLRV